MGGSLPTNCHSDQTESLHEREEDSVRRTDSNVQKVVREDAISGGGLDNREVNDAPNDGSDHSQPRDLRSHLQRIEEDVRAFTAKYRKETSDRELSPDTRLLLEEKMCFITDEFRRVNRSVSATTTESELSTAFLGIRKRRFKSLRDVVRKVITDIRISRILQSWTEMARKAEQDIPHGVDFDHLIGKNDLEVWDGVDVVLDLDRRCSEPLFQVFMAVWQLQNMGRIVKANHQKVTEYVRAVEAGYHRANPYHNNAHAAEVTLMTYQIWSYLSAGSFKGYFEQVDLLVVLLAAAIHDIGHPATNNDFLVKTKTELACRYHDTAVLENFHLATAFDMMRSRSFSILDHYLPNPPVTSLRRRITEIVLATDMAVHKKQVDDMSRLVERNMKRQEIDKRQLEQYIVHTADVGHPFRPVPQHQEWARRVNEEFLAQGDREKELGFTPIEMFDREKAPTLPKNQLGFLQFVIQPLWKPMEVLLDTKGRPASLFLQRNIKVWEEEMQITG